MKSKQRGNGLPLLFIACIALFFCAICYLFIASVKEAERKKLAFMEECRQDHKQYECTALWRKGEDTSTVIPIPVIIPR